MKRLMLLLLFLVSATCGASPPPPANEVFHVTATRYDPNTLQIKWQISPGYFLYSDRMKFTSASNRHFHVGTLRFPASLAYKDKQGVVHKIYRDQVTVAIPILGTQPGEALLNLHYQGCSDAGFCYPPQSVPVKLTIDANRALTSVFIEKTNPLPVKTEQSAQYGPVKFSDRNLFMSILSFFGVGLLLAFTPCILPMIPVLSGIIVGHGHDLTHRKAFLLSLSYVLSMSVTYALIGAVFALLGNNLQIAMQSPWVITAFSLVFVLLALSMFNFYEFRLPISWQAALARVTRSQTGGHYLGAAIMGCLSILILSPCVTPALLGALGYIAQTGDIVLGTSALFFLGLGMGTPLLLLGMSAKSWLPKAGTWMNAVKSFFGVLLAAIAIQLMSRILPPALTMALWACGFIFLGVFVGAFVNGETNRGKFRQGLGIILLVYGLLMLIGASLGNTNPFQPLALQKRTQVEEKKVFRTLNAVQQAITVARGKPVILDFYADWCTSCVAMEASLFRKANIQTALRDFVVLKIDVTAANADSRELLRYFNVVAPPTFLFFTKQGEEIPSQRITGAISSSDFLNRLHKLQSVSPKP